MSTVAWITARGLFGRRRVLLLLPLPALLIGLALLCEAYDVNRRTGASRCWSASAWPWCCRWCP